MSKNEVKKIAKEGLIGGVGSLIGYAIGGVPGVIVGASIAPTTKMAISIYESHLERKRARLCGIVFGAAERMNISEEELLNKLSNDPVITDQFFTMIQQLINTDPELDELFSQIIASFFSETEDSARRRLIVLVDSVKGINYVQAQILYLLDFNGGSMTSIELADAIGVPEIELRNSVRDLELRGMIIDDGSEPPLWKLRELGMGVAQAIKKVRGTI